MAINWSDTSVYKDNSSRAAEWHSIHNNPLITEPFVAYIGPTTHRRFADWLYKYGGTSQKRFNKKFGKFEPLNLEEVALSDSKDQRSQKLDKQVEDKLTKMQEQLLEQEKQLYQDLGCANFLEFRKMWNGAAAQNTGQIDEEKRWLRYHLSLLSGETLRLATDKGQTEIEQLLDLVAIKLDKLEISGMEQDKYKIKQDLLDADILQLVEQTYKRTNSQISVYVPTKRVRGHSEKEFVSTIVEYYTKKLGKDVTNILKDNLEHDFEEYFLYTLQHDILGDSGVLARKNQARREKTLDSSFIDATFSKAVTPARQAKVLASILKKFFEKARRVDMTSEEWEAWTEADKHRQMSKYINKQFEALCKDFVYQQNPFGINEPIQVMGLLGELGAHGYGFFFLEPLSSSERRIDILNVGTLRSVETGQFLGTDTVITVNGNNYGIQVKNPFQTDKGFYDTYRNAFDFSSDSKIEALKNAFGFSQEQFEAFEMYNLNINSTTNPDYFVKQIKKFLLMNADNLARLDEQHIRTDFTKQQTKALSSLRNSGVNNVFYIVKGEIFPSSYILQGLINQYHYLQDYINDKMKITDYGKSKLQIGYSNNIKVVVSSREDESKPFVEVGENYVRRDIRKELQKIKINSILHLEIPSIEDLNKFYDL